MYVDHETLESVSKASAAFASLRSNRDRNMRYTFGDQWSDVIPDTFGFPVREGDFAAGSGSYPITNNLIRPLVKTIVGRYRTQHTEDYAKVAGAYENDLPELDARLLEEYLISGCAVQRIHPEERPERTGVWVDNVSPAHFFVNPHRDPRGTDVTLVGMYHYLNLHQILNRFAHGKPELVRQVTEAVGRSQAEEMTGRYRIIEVWTLDSSALLACHDKEAGKLFDLPAGETQNLRAENRKRAAKGRKGITATWYAPSHWHCRWLTT